MFLNVNESHRSSMQTDILSTNSLRFNLWRLAAPEVDFFAPLHFVHPARPEASPPAQTVSGESVHERFVIFAKIVHHGN